MLTLFSIPKPFEGHIGVIQRNAILSWTQLHPDCDIILFGDEPGIQEICQEFGLTHIPNIKRNDYGTPFLDDAFLLAQQHAKNDLLCYINTDIILLNTFIEAVNAIDLPEFVCIGERLNIDFNKPLSPDPSVWEAELDQVFKENGMRQGLWGIDYIVFRRENSIHMLPFLVGRMCWDNWFIYHCSMQRIPIINLTDTVSVYHQNHHYNHVQNGTGNQWYGPESDYNIRLIGGITAPLYCWNIGEADQFLRNGSLEKNSSFNNLIKKSVIHWTFPLHEIIEIPLLLVLGLYIRMKRKAFFYRQKNRHNP